MYLHTTLAFPNLFTYTPKSFDAGLIHILILICAPQSDYIKTGAEEIKIHLYSKHVATQHFVSNMLRSKMFKTHLVDISIVFIFIMCEMHNVPSTLSFICVVDDNDRIQTDSWIYIPQGRGLSPADCQSTTKPSPISRQPLAAIFNQSPSSRQPVSDWSQTGLRFLCSVLAHQSPTGPQLVGNWYADWFATENGGIDRTAVALVAAFLGR